MNNKLGGDFITFHYRYRKQIILGIIIFIILGTITTFVILKNSSKEGDIVIEENKIEKKEKVKKETPEAIYVDIKGEVNSPGIYQMKSNQRVIDVIDRAGGLTNNANTSVINLSKKIEDEMVIIIYSNEQVNSFYETKQKEKEVLEKCQVPEPDSIHNDACIDTSNQTISKININTGTKEELMTLPSIGESKAKDIITYREKNGPFEKKEDIKKVTGIGESIYSKIKENITV